MDNLELIVERDLAIIELQEIAKGKNSANSPISIMIDQATGFDQKRIKDTIKVVERVSELNEILGYPNVGKGSPKELARELKLLLK